MALNRLPAVTDADLAAQIEFMVTDIAPPAGGSNGSIRAHTSSSSTRVRVIPAASRQKTRNFGDTL